MRKQLNVAIPIEVNDRLASYFVDRVYNLLRIIGDAQEGGQSLHYQHLTFGKHHRFRLSFLRFHCLEREFRPSFLGLHRPMKGRFAIMLMLERNSPTKGAALETRATLLPGQNHLPAFSSHFPLGLLKELT